MNTRHSACCTGLALLLASSLSSAAGPLVPPAGFTAPAIKGHGDSSSCASPPAPFTGALEFPSKYEGSGKSRDVVNPAAEAKYKALTAPINDFQKGVVSMTEQYLHSGDRATLDCELGWLDRWASADAMEDRTRSHPGKSQRKWMLAAIASAWDRLKFSEAHPLDSADPAKVKDIERWFDKLGTLVYDDWRDAPLDKTNNHHYWAAWAAMADAVALNRRDLFDWSVQMYRTFANKQIDQDGFLPNEMARDTRALGYHNYSLEPLTMIAAFAAANGIDLASEGNNALSRLATRVLAGVDDPSIFEARAGGKQSLEDIREPDKFAWLEPYCSLVECSGDVQRRIDKLRPLKAVRMGGDMTELFAGGPKTRG